MLRMWYYEKGTFEIVNPSREQIEEWIDALGSSDSTMYFHLQDSKITFTLVYADEDRAIFQVNDLNRNGGACLIDPEYIDIDIEIDVKGDNQIGDIPKQETVTKNIAKYAINYYSSQDQLPANLMWRGNADFLGKYLAQVNGES